jgi:hypothetical protein
MVGCMISALVQIMDFDTPELDRDYDRLTARCCKMQLRAQRTKIKLDARISNADHSVQWSARGYGRSKGRLVK